jgi:zinc transport system substrate-binding protein
MSPPLFAAMATNTAGALRGLLPDAEIEAGLIKTVEEIAAAELEVRRRLTKNNVRTLLSYHSSYSYFAGHYGLRAMEIEHEGKAPSARRLAQVTREARACGVKRVLADVSSPRRAAETVARELDGKAVVVDPLRRDWILMMKEIASALSGD